MASIRGQLAVAYAVTLFVTVGGFAGIVYGARVEESRREMESRVASDADLALRIIDQVVAAGDSVTATNDRLVGPVVTPRLRTLLEGVPDYVVVLDSTGRTLYNSFAVRQLSTDEQIALSQLGAQLRADGQPHHITLPDGTTLLAAVRIRIPSTTAISRIVAGAGANSEAVAPGGIIATMALAAPINLILSIGGAYVISGRAFRPLTTLNNEVEAITDGRSLHRRLAIAGKSYELTRLGTTLNAMLSRLETSFGALRRFTTDASHELKTPLTVIRADLERALRAPPQSTDQLVALEEALAETRRMTDLVDSLLTLARADEGRFDIHREPVALDPLVRDVYDTALILGEDAEITISLPVLDAATTLGDERWLRQLFMNLVMNAIKYTSRGGNVEMSLHAHADSVAFGVKDSGIGIAPGDLPHIFERFWRADRARSRGSATAGSGFGLGLAICQWIAQAHGGTIAVTSRLGRGSMFTVTLPRADALHAEVELVPAKLSKS
jgi:two-component system OmpR family sensor kinase